MEPTKFCINNKCPKLLIQQAHETLSKTSNSQKGLILKYLKNVPDSKFTIMSGRSYHFLGINQYYKESCSGKQPGSGNTVQNKWDC